MVSTLLLVLLIAKGAYYEKLAIKILSTATIIMSFWALCNLFLQSSEASKNLSRSDVWEFFTSLTITSGWTQVSVGEKEMINHLQSE